jgi:hypothetical protein
MRGNYVYLTVGDYIYRQPGIFESLSIGNLVAADNGNWEIAMNEPDTDSIGIENNDGKHYEVPKMFKVTLSFKPIHNFLPKRMTSEMTDHTATFITPNHHLLASRKNRYLPDGTEVVKTQTTPPVEVPKPKTPVKVKTVYPKKKSIIPPPPPKPKVKEGGIVPPQWNPTPAPTMLRRGANDTIDNTRTKWSKYTNPNPDAGYWNDYANYIKKRNAYKFGGGGGFNGGGAGGTF